MSKQIKNPLSRKGQRETNRNPPNNPKTVTFNRIDNAIDSGAESPDEAAPVAGTKQTTPSQAAFPPSAKRTRTADENTMEVDLDTSQQNSSTSAGNSNSQLTPD